MIIFALSSHGPCSRQRPPCRAGKKITAARRPGRVATGGWVLWYNPERPDGSIDGFTPARFSWDPGEQLRRVRSVRGTVSAWDPVTAVSIKRSTSCELRAMAPPSGRGQVTLP